MEDGQGALRVEPKREGLLSPSVDDLLSFEGYPMGHPLGASFSSSAEEEAPSSLGDYEYDHWTSFYKADGYNYKNHNGSSNDPPAENSVAVGHGGHDDKHNDHQGNVVGDARSESAPSVEGRKQRRLLALDYYNNNQAKTNCLEHGDQIQSSSDEKSESCRSPALPR